MKELDKKIKELRHKVFNPVVEGKAGEDKQKLVEQVWKDFEELSRLQKERFNKFGSFLPAKGGRLYVYSQIDDCWLTY